VHTPEVNSGATLSYIIGIDGFRIAYRDSGGKISDEELGYFAANPGVDVAILSLNGLHSAAVIGGQIFSAIFDLQITARSLARSCTGR
jgi:hypothetical protein